MLANSKAFSGFSVDDLEPAKRFYGETLGLTVEDIPEMGGLMRLRLAGETDVLIYAKPGHEPATFTVLNFPVPDIGATVDALAASGVQFERYEAMASGFDDKGIFRGGGPLIAWFTDPAGNVLSVIEQDDA